MTGIHGPCSEHVRWVFINRVTVAVELSPHDRGTVAVPNSPNHSIAYELAHDAAPGPGFTRHRRHECPKCPKETK